MRKAVEFTSVFTQLFQVLQTLLFFGNKERKFSQINMAITVCIVTCLFFKTFFHSTARYHEPYYVEVELKDTTLKVSQEESSVCHRHYDIYREVLQDTGD